jgi:uncharacterized membrane protein SpoIIM required for sporulation
MIGAVLLMVDSESKAVLIPFGSLMQSPSERVADEESRQQDHLAGRKGQGAAFYITHNTQVALVTLSLGITWGLGSILLLFYNGIMLGAVCTDYVLAGKTVFLMGWLMPHGATEIPAILIAGQAAFLIAHAMIGWRSRKSFRTRMREVSPDLVTITGGVVILLIWAGVVEAYLSQYHDPVLPYWIKITFGSVTILLLTLYLGLAGRGKTGNRSAS